MENIELWYDIIIRILIKTTDWCNDQVSLHLNNTD